MTPGTNSQGNTTLYTRKEISRYYDLSEVHYKLFWGLDQSKGLHYGYWDETTKSHHDSVLNANRKMAEAAKITKDDVVLDAGCGVGGSSLWMANNIGCKVTGITINERQANRAKEFAKQDGLEEKVHFEVNDYTSTGFPENSFSVIWGMETVCYANDKMDFLNEAKRILKPGGRLIIADVFKKEGLKGKDAEIMKGLANGWAITEHSTPEQFEQQLRSAGFVNIRFTDITQPVMPSIKRLYKAWFLGVIPSKIYNLLHPNATELAKRNVDTAKLQYQGIKKGLWKYMHVYAEKGPVMDR